MGIHPRAAVTAMHGGFCDSCQSRIHEGDVIVLGESGWLHAVCEPVLTDDFDIQPGEKVCPTCYCVHKGECL